MTTPETVEQAEMDVRIDPADGRFVFVNGRRLARVMGAESGGGAPAGADGGDGGEDGEAEQQAAVLTPDALEEQFERFRQEIPNLVQQPQQQGQEPEQQGPEDYGQVAEQLLQDWQQNVGEEITAEDLQQLVQGVSQAVSQQTLAEALPQALDQALAPIHNRFLQQDAEKLEADYPELTDPKIQGEVVQMAVAKAAALGDPEMARNPAFVEMAYKAYKADQIAEAQRASGNGNQDGDIVLEGGGGALPGGDEGQTTADEIVGARRGGSRLFV